MATATQTPQVPTQETAQPTTSTQPVTYEFTTYGRVQYVDGFVENKETGEKTPTYDYKWVNEKAADKVAKDGKFEDHEAVLEFKQTFKFPHANTKEGVMQLYTNSKGEFVEDEFTNQNNNAISVKLGNKTRSLGMAKDDDGNFTFQASETPIDLTEEVCALTSRRRTPFEKLLDETKNQVGNFSPEMRAQLMALLQGGQITT